MKETMPAMLSVDSSARLQTAANPAANPQNSAEGVESTPFTAFLASYFAAVPEQAGTFPSEVLITPAGENLPQQAAVAGNSLPGSEANAIWGLFFLTNPQLHDQPAEDAVNQQVFQLFTPQRTPSQPMDSNVMLLNSNKPLPEGMQDINQTFVNALAKQQTLQSAGIEVQPQAIRAEQLLTTNLSDPNSGLNLFNQSGFSQNSLSGHLNTVTAATQALHTAPPLNPAHPSWDNALTSRLQFMLGQNVQKAEIRLDPPDLGLVEVQVQVTRDQAQVSFSSPHAQVRDAIEACVPRLREMFAESGLSLADVNVQQENLAQQQGNQASDQEQQATGHVGQSLTNEEIAQADGQQGRQIIVNGLLDAYA